MRLLNYLTGLVIVTLALVTPAFAADGGALITTEGMKFLALALAIFGGALGQSRVMASALESIGRNPGAAGQMFVPWLFGLAFIESLFILAWLIAAGFIG